jgi:F420H(2)-dependent quinone reductase
VSSPSLVRAPNLARTPRLTALQVAERDYGVQANGWGRLCLTSIGGRTGRERTVIIGSFVDGPNLIALAVNRWAGGEPDWWLNLQAHADAKVALADGRARCVLAPRTKMNDRACRPCGARSMKGWTATRSRGSNSQRG